MGQTYKAISEKMQKWVAKQRLYFVATAPNDADGHINLSPKGAMDTFAILGPKQVAYLDLVGSGVETVSHIRENGRIVIMLCAFEGPPKIVRFHGKGRSVQQHDPEFADLLKHFTRNADLEATTRSIVVVDVERVSDSCGFVVPRMDYVGERNQLYKWAHSEREEEGDEWLEKYIAANNTESIDGLRGLDVDVQLTEEEAQELSSVGKAL